MMEEEEGARTRPHHARTEDEERAEGKEEQLALLERFDDAARSGSMDLVDVAHLREELDMLPQSEVDNVRRLAAAFTEALSQPQTVDGDALADVEAETEQAAEAQSNSNSRISRYAAPCFPSPTAGVTMSTSKALCRGAWCTCLGPCAV